MRGIQWRNIKRLTPAWTILTRKLLDLPKIENELKYTFNSSYQSGSFSLHKLNGKWGYIDPENNVAIDFQFDDAFPFSEDLACVHINGKCGYIDASGKVQIEATFDSASFFLNGTAEVKKNQKTYRIDRFGNRID